MSAPQKDTATEAAAKEAAGKQEDSDKVQGNKPDQQGGGGK